jgi:hypothetical protein
MRERHVLYGVLFIVGAMVVTGWSPVARAITPTGPGLQDGNGVYLGQLLSVNYGSDPFGGNAPEITYSTYLPDVDGIMQFKTYREGGPTLFSNVPQKIYFKQADCTGTAYVSFDSNDPWIHPWIVEGSMDQTTWLIFKVASSSLANISVQSYMQPFSCVNEAATLTTGYKLKPITLPFDPNTVALPYKITP